MNDKLTILAPSPDIDMWLSRFSESNGIRSVLLQLACMVYSNDTFDLDKYLMSTTAAVTSTDAIGNYAKSVSANAGAPKHVVDDIYVAVRIISNGVLAMRMSRAIPLFIDSLKLDEEFKKVLSCNEIDIADFYTAVVTNAPTTGERTKSGVNDIIKQAISGLLTALIETTGGERTGVIIGAHKDGVSYIYRVDDSEHVQKGIKAFFNSIEKQ